MFAKLLRQEWRATRRGIGLLCVIILVCGLTIGLTMGRLNAMEEENSDLIVTTESTVTVYADDDDGWDAFFVILIMACVAAVAVCDVGSVVYLLLRFYRRHFTDEGYLTHTLPVGEHELLLSSMVNTVLGVTLVVLASAVAVCIALGVFLVLLPGNLRELDSWMKALAYVWHQMGQYGQELARFALTGALSALALLVSAMLSITVGAMIARKHKLLAAVGVFFAIDLVESYVQGLVLFHDQSQTVLRNLLRTSAGVHLVTILVGYFLMHYLMGHKLNLNQ